MQFEVQSLLPCQLSQLLAFGTRYFHTQYQIWNSDTFLCEIFILLRNFSWNSFFFDISIELTNIQTVRYFYQENWKWGGLQSAAARDLLLSATIPAGCAGQQQQTDEFTKNCCAVRLRETWVALFVGFVSLFYYLFFIFLWLLLFCCCCWSLRCAQKFLHFSNLNTL